MVTSLPGRAGARTHDWAVVPWVQYVAPHVVTVDFPRWAQVVRRFVEDL